MRLAVPATASKAEAALVAISTAAKQATRKIAQWVAAAIKPRQPTMAVRHKPIDIDEATRRATEYRERRRRR